MSEYLDKYDNLLNRDFNAEKPNTKWVTDISYIHTDQGVLYLSMIRDLHNAIVVSHKTGFEQTDKSTLNYTNKKKTLVTDVMQSKINGWRIPKSTVNSMIITPRAYI